MDRRWASRGVGAALVLAAGAAGAQVQVTAPVPGVRMVYGVNGGNPTALLVVDLCAPGVSVRTTRYDERGALAADWAARTGVDLAINGDLFDFGSYAVGHWARSGGVDWPAGTHNQEPHPNLAFGPGFAMRGELPPLAAATDVIGGIPEIVIDGRVNPSLPDTDFINGPHRRTAVGLSRDRRTLFLFSTDGTAAVPGVAFGMGVFAGQVPGAPAVWWSLNLDGGGSSQMWVRGVGTVIPSTRPVANHLGIFARGAGASPHCPVRDPRCPATGLAQACLDRTRIADCADGVLSLSSGDCGAYGAVCAPARPAGPGCVIGFCLSDPARRPYDHDACGYDGRLTHCAADGTFNNPRACPAGTTCQTRPDGTGVCAPPGSRSMDASVDAPPDDGPIPTDAIGPTDAAWPSDQPHDDRFRVVEDVMASDAGAPSPPITGDCGCRLSPRGRSLPWVTAVVLARLARRRRPSASSG